MGLYIFVCVHLCIVLIFEYLEETQNHLDVFSVFAKTLDLEFQAVILSCVRSLNVKSADSY